MATRTRRGFGSIRKLPSKRYQVRFQGLDGAAYTAPLTFSSKLDAEGWLATERRRMDSGTWAPPQPEAGTTEPAGDDSRPEAAPEPITLQEWAEQWMHTRELRLTTRDGYERLLANHILPELGQVPLEKLSRARLRAWYAHLDPATPRARSKAYSLLRSILTGAIDAEIIAGPNPCQIRGAGPTSRAHTIEPLTPAELAALVDAMPERLRLAVRLGCWGALRYGEIAELRRKDVLVDEAVVKVRRGVTWTKGVATVGPPKRDFTADRPNAKWVGDMTEIPTEHGKLYLATVIDLYSRRLLGAATGLHPDADLACAAIKMAVATRGGKDAIWRADESERVIFHTDRGSTYTANSFTRLCRQQGIRQSMGRVGSCFDCEDEDGWLVG